MNRVVRILILSWCLGAAAQHMDPGDPRAGYELGSYNTNSRKLEAPTGESADLLALINQPPLGLPPLKLDRSPTQAGIDLGRRLFFDRRLSFNQTLSCAMCHIPEQGFGQYELTRPVGIEGRAVKRNSPPLYNVAYRKFLFVDGREEILEQQIWGPLLAHNEMGNPSIGTVLKRLANDAYYVKAFSEAYQQDINMLSLGQALADYERGLLSAASPFDQWYFNDDAKAVSASVKRGLDVFVVAECSACHHFEQSSALFTDNRFHDIGIGYRASIKSTGASQVQLAPGVFVNANNPALPTLSDLGRYEATGLSSDKWKYLTPGLRNINITRPYMHDGSIATLEEVIEYYNDGGVPHPGQDSRIRPLHLTPRQKSDLLAFLKSLTGSNVDALARDARVAPIGER